MKVKLLSLLLSAAMILSLAGCNNPSQSSTPTSSNNPSTQGQLAIKPVRLKLDSSDVEMKSLEDVREQVESELNSCSLKYDFDKGYSEDAKGDYLYPLYINIDGNLKTIYLSLSSLNSVDPYYQYEDAIFGVEAPLGSSAKTGNAITNGINSILGGLTGSKSSSAMTNESFAATPVIDTPVIDTPMNTSEYNRVNESGFLSTKTNPLSTFSADVDNASYTNIRAILRENLCTLVESEDGEKYNYGHGYYSFDNMHDIRIEEMLNYFSFSDNNESNDVFAIKSEIADTPWNKDTKLMTVNIKAKELPAEEETGSNLVLLIDTSGSMNEYNKMGLVKTSSKMLIDNLSDMDVLSIVTYSGSFELLADGVAVENNRERLYEIIDSLGASGGTNGSGGIETAYKVAEKYKNSHSNSRIIMFSDGDLNVGVTSADGLERLVESKRDKGIYLTILGFGLGNYKDTKMEVLADKGNGNYYYIDSLKEGYRVLVDKLTSTLRSAADDVKFQIEFNPNYVKAYRKIGYENRDLADADFSDDTKDAGEVGYGHEVTLVYELVLNDSQMVIPEIGLKYQSTEATGNETDFATLNIRYKNPGESTSNLIDYVIDNSKYTETPSDDWKFISDVVGFGLLVNGSKYINELELGQIIDSLSNSDLTDDDRMEFLAIVELYNLYLENSLEK